MNVVLYRNRMMHYYCTSVETHYVVHCRIFKWWYIAIDNSTFSCLLILCQLIISRSKKPQCLFCASYNTSLIYLALLPVLINHIIQIINIKISIRDTSLGNLLTHSRKSPFQSHRLICTVALYGIEMWSWTSTTDVRY